MEAEAALLEAFSSLPALGRGWAFPAATHDGVRITLQLQQRNLAANAQRKYLTSFLLNEAVLEAGEPDCSLPAEQPGVLLYSPSPSGRRLLVVRAGAADASAGASACRRTCLSTLLAATHVHAWAHPASHLACLPPLPPL